MFLRMLFSHTYICTGNVVLGLLLCSGVFGFLDIHCSSSSHIAHVFCWEDNSNCSFWCQSRSSNHTLGKTATTIWSPCSNGASTKQLSFGIKQCFTWLPGSALLFPALSCCMATCFFQFLIPCFVRFRYSSSSPLRILNKSCRCK